MKLLIATGLYAPEIGGPATHTKLLEEHLPALGYTVSVVPFARSRGLPKLFRHLHYTAALLRRARQVDVLFAQDTVSVGLPALLVSKLLRKPLVVRVPGDYAWEQSVQRFGVTDSIDEFQVRRQSMRVRLLQSVQSAVVRRASLVITPSVYFQTLVAGWGVAPAQNITIYNGVDLHITPAQLPALPPQTMVTSGRLVAWKGIDKLIELLVTLDDWHLTIIGDGPQRGALEQQAQSLGVADRVTFTGSISREAVFAHCVAADAFVLNTHFESFSYQVVEAMYSGSPTIVTNVGSLPELITHGVEGVLFTPDDLPALATHIRSTQTDTAVWHKRTQAAVLKVQVFTIQACIAKLDTQLQLLHD